MGKFLFKLQYNTVTKNPFSVCLYYISRKQKKVSNIFYNRRRKSPLDLIIEIEFLFGVALHSQKKNFNVWPLAVLTVMLIAFHF